MNSYETIQQALVGISGQGVVFSLEKPGDVAHGDYATNIAFALSGVQSLSPKQCAEDIVPVLYTALSARVEKIEVAGPGFINFFLKDDVVRKENEGRAIVTKFTGKNILVEHSSPNLFKPFHIGHLVNNIIGEFVARATRAGGANVTVVSFPSDVSLGIAKAVYMIHKDGGLGALLPRYAKEGISYLGDCYVRGVSYYDEHPAEQEAIKEVARKIYAMEHSDEYDIYSAAKRFNIEYFEHIMKSIGSQFDNFIYESEAGVRGLGIVKEYTPKVFTESEGAIVYIPDESRKDINTAVFINSQGNPTYEAKDIGLIDIKFSQYNPDYSFFITDAEQVSHFKVVLDAYETIEIAQKEKFGELQWEATGKSIHIPHGRMLVKGKKMSSRLGGVPLALDVIRAVEEEVRERAGEKIAHLTDAEKEKLTREIALSALRITVLRSKLGININFDPETSLSFEGDSGPYLMYTHARAVSLLEKGKDVTPLWGAYPVTDLEKEMLHFENIVEDTLNELAPQKLVSYLFSVAQLFNSYYASTQVIVDNDIAGNAHRLMIVQRVRVIMRDGLHILGIEAPLRM